jgi:hypothetical protein
MRFASLFLVLTAITAGAAEKEEGFVPLFDGKSFAGWKTNADTAKVWTVADGMLVLSGGGNKNNLYTEKSYGDFIIRFEFRPKKEGYNSGFYIRGNNQINLAQKAAGQLMGNKNAKAVPELHKAPGEWNEWEVTCVGSKVTLKVNGKEAWTINDFKPTSGTIGIQAEGAPIDFRNLRIKEIKP